LSYSSQVKAAQLESQGYFSDVSGFFDRTDDVNSGFYSRNRLFRTNYKSDGAYKKEGTRFFGKLNLDLVSIDTGLLPGMLKMFNYRLKVFLLPLLEVRRTCPKIPFNLLGFKIARK